LIGLKAEKAKMFRSLIFVATCLSCLASLSLADLPPGYQQLTAAEKLNILWSKVTVKPYAMTSLPTKDPSAFDMAKLFGGKYDSVSFTQASDEMPKNREKLIHTYGSAAKVELKIFPNSTYTGIFKTGGVGIARLSVAKQDKTNFIPGMALKVLIDGQRSQNFQVWRTSQRLMEVRIQNPISFQSFRSCTPWTAKAQTATFSKINSETLWPNRLPGH
jgi:hypothetical protein